MAVCAGTLGCCRDSNCEHVWSLWGSGACAGGPHEGEAVALYVTTTSRTVRQEHTLYYSVQ